MTLSQYSQRRIIVLTIQQALRDYKREREARQNPRP